MGIEYVLADRRNRRLFVLGKGLWWTVFEPLPLTEDETVCRVVKMWADMYAQHTPDSFRWIAGVALRLWKFVEMAEREVFLASDAGDEWWELSQNGYIETDTRYDADRMLP